MYEGPTPSPHGSRGPSWCRVLVSHLPDKETGMHREVEPLAPGHTASEDCGQEPADEGWRGIPEGCSLIGVGVDPKPHQFLAFAHSELLQAPWGRGDVEEFDLNGQSGQFGALRKARLWAKTQRRGQPKAWPEEGWRVSVAARWASPW